MTAALLFFALAGFGWFLWRALRETCDADRRRFDARQRRSEFERDADVAGIGGLRPRRWGE